MEIERKQQLKVPGPGSYDAKTKPFEGAVTFGYTFGSRQGFAGAGGKKKQPPGPGNYDIPGMLATTKGFAFGTKQHSGQLAKSKRGVVPGPGAYHTVRDGGWPKPPSCRHVRRLKA